MTLLDAAQIAGFQHFLGAMKGHRLTRARLEAIKSLDPFMKEWALGYRPVANICGWTFPG